MTSGSLVEVSTVDVDGGVVTVVRMTAGENLINPAFVDGLATALDRAADPGGPLVLTGTGKFFCNGLDLAWLGSASPDELGATFRAFYRVLARLLRFPGATVAAVNGHAFGAGAILATAADYRVQRADRGYFCLPEIDLGVPLSPEFEAVLRAKLPPAALLDALLTGRRYGGPDAQAAGFVHATAAEDKLLDTAVDLVRGLVAKSSRATAALRSGLYRDVLAVLDPGND